MKLQLANSIFCVADSGKMSGKGYYYYDYDYAVTKDPYYYKYGKMYGGKMGYGGKMAKGYYYYYDDYTEPTKDPYYYRFGKVCTSNEPQPAVVQRFGLLTLVYTLQMEEKWAMEARWERDTITIMMTTRSRPRIPTTTSTQRDTEKCVRPASPGQQKYKDMAY